MGAAKQMWMDENERITGQFEDGEIDEVEFRATMKDQGFDPQEIDDMVDGATA